MAPNLSVSGDGHEQPLVLVVDDEPTLRETIAYNLRRQEWTVALAADGEEALRLARSLDPDVIVLDVLLPGLDGFQVCRQIRASSNVPILFLSARGEEVDRVLGLDLGGDDYLTKPFAMRELIAHVRAMLRRSHLTRSGLSVTPSGDEAMALAAGRAASGSDVLVAGVLTLDPARRTARLGEDALALKPKEFDLLAYLMRHPGLVLSRDALLREVWGYDFPMETRTVDVHIRWLRQKLGDDSSHPTWIETVRGHGYRFAGSGG